MQAGGGHPHLNFSSESKDCLRERQLSGPSLRRIFMIGWVNELPDVSENMSPYLIRGNFVKVAGSCQTNARYHSSSKVSTKMIRCGADRNVNYNKENGYGCLPGHRSHRKDQGL